MSTFVMLVGPAGAGKSTYAEKVLIEQYDAFYLSSDIIRATVFGNEKDQSHNYAVFQLMCSNSIQKISEGISVIYDATNLSIKRRVELLNQLPPCEKICYYFKTPLDICLKQNNQRERHVNPKVIERMYKTLEKPTYEEGWDRIYSIKGVENV